MILLPLVLAMLFLRAADAPLCERAPDFDARCQQIEQDRRALSE